MLCLRLQGLQPSVNKTWWRLSSTEADGHTLQPWNSNNLWWVITGIQYALSRDTSRYNDHIHEALSPDFFFNDDDDIHHALSHILSHVIITWYLFTYWCWWCPQQGRQTKRQVMLLPGMISKMMKIQTCSVSQASCSKLTLRRIPRGPALSLSLPRCPRKREFHYSWGVRPP